MMFGAPIAFAAPVALLGLFLLPAIWWLLRVTPPAPARTPFPPLRLLLGLKREEETPARTPPWLLVLRLAVAAAVVLAMAGPSWRPAAPIQTGAGPLLLILDDGWAAAPDWRARVEFASTAARQAGDSGRSVAVVLASDGAVSPVPGAADDALARIAAAKPRPYAPTRSAQAAAVAAFLDATPRASALWLADGISAEGEGALAAALRARATSHRIVVALGAPPPPAL
ncbi:MAG: BatA domain-containing protein, partial [Hyphomicrobiales bacterium]|nr:BatA domain-containing protein [Hyphomicrobiales bacterium]